MDLYIYLVNITSYIFLMLFIYHYNRLKYSKVLNMTMLAGLWIALTGVDWQRYRLEGREVSIISISAVLVQAVLITLVSVYLSEYQDWRTVFSGFMSSNYVLLGNTTVLIFVFLTGNRVLGFIAGIVVHVLVFLLMKRMLYDAYMKVFDNVNLHWGAWCFVPILFYFIYFTSTTFPSSVIETPSNMVTSLLSSIVMITFYSIFFKYLEYVYEQQEVQGKMMLMDAFANGVKIQAESVRKTENEVRILRHDLKHLLNLVSIMLEQGEYDRAKELLEQYAPPDMKNNYRTFCDNTVINGILNTALLKGKKADLDIRIRANVPEDIAIADMDVALVVSNLMDNAIRSVKDIKNMDDRWVEITIKLVDNNLIIETQNPFDGEIQFDKETGFPKSKRGKNHGFGIQSIGAVAWKYHGLTDFFIDKKLFISRIMLMNISVEENEE